MIAPKDAFTSKLVSEGIEYMEVEISNYGTNPYYELRLIWKLVKLYREIKPNIIFHYTIKPNIYGSIAASICGVPSIIITTGLGHLYEFKNVIVKNISLLLYRLACRLSQQTWFLNTNDRDVFVYNGVVKKEKALVLKGEGINLDWFYPQKEKVKRKKTTFLFAGRILKDKGIIEFIEAAKYCKLKDRNVEFQVLGFIDQSNPNSLPYEDLQYWQSQKIINYLGETTDVRPYLQWCDCLVFPTYYREGISRILMEASAMETPIITTDHVGCREIVSHKVNGFLAESKSLDSLKYWIDHFLEMSMTDRIIMGKAGRSKMMREYDEKYIFDQYDLCIDTVLGIERLTSDLALLQSKRSLK